MKEKLVILFGALFVIILMPSYAFANDSLMNRYIETEYYPDCSYVVIETIIEQPNFSLFATEKTKSASRTYTYYNKNNEAEWDFTVKGTFSYDGISASAKSATSSYNIYVNGWKCTNRKAWTTGATAKGSATFIYNSLMSKDVTLGLKCSANGSITSA